MIAHQLLKGSTRKLTRYSLDDERILMRRIAAGDERAIAAIIDRWIPGFYGFTDGLRMSDEAADAVIEEVFRRVMFEAPRFVARPERFHDWLQTTVRNCAASTIAKNSMYGRQGAGGLAASRAPQPSEGEACLALLREQRLPEALSYLNSLTEFRFTGIYRFDGMSVQNIHLFDRESGFGSDGSTAPISTTYCLWINETLSVVQMRESLTDPRAIAHPKREVVRSYCGGPICNEAGDLVGTICHFDYEPRDVPPRMLAILEAVGPSLESAVTANLAELA